MAKIKKTPELRFMGFIDEWEEKELRDEATEIVAGGDVDSVKISDSGEYPVLANALTNEGVIGYYKEDYRIKAPAVTVTGRGDVGHAKVRRINFTPVVRLLSIKTNHDVYFLENAINIHEVLIESTGVPQLTVPHLASFKICFPEKKTEEAKIGSFFQNLDALIALHERKHDKLCTVKKAMLEKMFPKEGADIPEIRFKGFTGKWKKKKLKEICEEFQSGKNIKAIDIGSCNIYPVYGGNGLRGYSDTYNHNGTYALIGRQGALCGNLNISYGKAYFTEHAIAVRANTDSDTEFLFYLLGKMNLGQYSGQSAQPGLAVNKIVELSSAVPEYNEQKKVSAFFISLDSLISLHKRELDKLKNIKNACLGKMFV